MITYFNKNSLLKIILWLHAMGFVKIVEPYLRDRIRVSKTSLSGPKWSFCYFPGLNCIHFLIPFRVPCIFTIYFCGPPDWDRLAKLSDFLRCFSTSAVCSCMTFETTHLTILIYKNGPKLTNKIILATIVDRIISKTTLRHIHNFKILQFNNIKNNNWFIYNGLNK